MRRLVDERNANGKAKSEDGVQAAPLGGEDRLLARIPGVQGTLRRRVSDTRRGS